MLALQVKELQAELEQLHRERNVEKQKLLSTPEEKAESKFFSFFKS